MCNGNSSQMAGRVLCGSLGGENNRTEVRIQDAFWNPSVYALSRLSPRISDLSGRPSLREKRIDEPHEPVNQTIRQRWGDLLEKNCRVIWTRGDECDSIVPVTMLFDEILFG